MGAGMYWYVSRGHGDVEGPFTAEQVVGMIQSGVPVIAVGEAGGHGWSEPRLVPAFAHAIAHGRVAPWKPSRRAVWVTAGAIVAFFILIGPVSEWLTRRRTLALFAEADREMEAMK